MLSAVPPLRNIEYDRYDFKRTTFVIDAEGNLDEILSIDVEQIEISKHWHAFIGDKPQDGYLSQGATKFAFLVGVTSE
jgi:hypothetical protein